MMRERAIFLIWRCHRLIHTSYLNPQFNDPAGFVCVLCCYQLRVIKFICFSQDPARHVMLAEVQLDLLLKYAADGEGKSEDLAAQRLVINSLVEQDAHMS